MLFHIYKCCRFQKSNQSRAPELEIPAEWQHSKVSRQNVTQTRNSKKNVKTNQMLYSVLSLFGIIGKKFVYCSHLQLSQFRKSNKNKAPELGIPAE